MTVDGATVIVVGAGYAGKRRAYQKLAKMGARLVIVDEPGHWSESLVADGFAADWLPAPVTGDADADAATILDALRRRRVDADGVLTYWEDSVSAAARVAAALDLPGNPPEAVDAARSKIRMREVSARLGLPTPKAKRVRSLDELYAAAAHVGFPAVVKPEFGASAMGCVRVDDLESLPGVYRLVRDVVRPETDGIFRAGNDLLLEEYLDGVEFDVDVVMQDGERVFSSVSQNWPTAEPSLQETGLHCPPDHSRRAVSGLVELSVETARQFGLRRGVLHVEGKCTSRGPRIVELNARMGGGRVHQIVEAVWGVDLVEAQLRSSLDLPQALKPSRRPRCAVVNAIVHAPATGRLEALPFREKVPELETGVELDLEAEIGDDVVGPDRTFATVLAELTVSGKNLRRARSLTAQLLRDPPLVRRPSRRMAEGIVTYGERAPVDAGLAAKQHAAYVGAIADAGWTIRQVPTADALPDSAFVEDTVVVCDELAVLTRPGAAERCAELAGTEETLRVLGLEIARIEEPGTLDGGDILQVGTTLYAGRGGRTNSEGIRQLRRLVAPRGWTVVPVQLHGVLHLKSAVTALPDRTIIAADESLLDSSAFPTLRLVPEEAGAHVVLLGGGTLLMAASAPRSAELFDDWGFDVIAVDISEFEKMEGCVTCLSVLVQRT